MLLLPALCKLSRSGVSNTAYAVIGIITPTCSTDNVRNSFCMLTGQTYRQPLHVIFQQDLSRTYLTHHELESVIIESLLLLLFHKDAWKMSCWHDNSCMFCRFTLAYGVSQKLLVSHSMWVHQPLCHQEQSCHGCLPGLSSLLATLCATYGAGIHGWYGVVLCHCLLLANQHGAGCSGPRFAGKSLPIHVTKLKVLLCAQICCGPLPVDGGSNFVPNRARFT